jgi:uncharacterized Zn-binding protein involved in type VI secretion
MAIPIHRNGDSRTCGAATVVAGQNTVFANRRLVSVNADPNSHGGGALSARCNQVFVNGKMVVIVGNSAAPDSLCPPLGGAHCAPASSSGSGNVFVGS